MKLPLSFTLKTRDNTTDKDARVLNGYVEIRGDKKKGGSIRTFKRPALDSVFELTAGGGQALYVPNVPDGGGFTAGEPGVVIGDILTRAPTPIVKRLRFTVQPSDVALNTAISPSIQVAAVDAFGNTVTGFANNITLALATNPTSATLGGTVTQAPASGVSTFNDITLNRSGEAFTLRATATGTTSVVSTAFTIATNLVFTVQPASGQPETTLDPIEVTAQDLDGNTDTNFTGNVTLSIYSNSSGGTLSGTLTVAAIAGVVSFANVEIDVVGLYTLKAECSSEVLTTSYKPARVVSDSFAIGQILVAAFDGVNVIGFAVTPPVGSLTPDTVMGETVITLFTADVGGGNFDTYVTVSGLHAQGLFTSLTINNNTLLSSTATYIQGGGNTVWAWFGENLIPAIGTYTVEFV